MPFKQEYDSALDNLHFLSCRHDGISLDLSDRSSFFGCLALRDAQALVNLGRYVQLEDSFLSPANREELERVFGYYDTLMPLLSSLDPYKFGLLLHCAYIADVSDWMYLVREDPQSDVITARTLDLARLYRSLEADLALGRSRFAR